MPGYDAAQKDKKNDDLGRWRFAAEIAQVIRTTPAEWSARIGIFGKWGEGKSTILHFLEDMLKPEENVIFSFNPWAIQDISELWAEFGTALIHALDEAALLEETWLKRNARKIQEAAKDTGLAALGEGAAQVFGKDKLYNGAFGMVSGWLKPDGPQVKKIREGLGKRRVIVFIDDLDRATPELLPKLLLSLREILDLPGFTFVLAFDNEIVSDGLVTANKAWGDGANFLEKILDFRYYLPKVSKEGKRLLLKNMLAQYCDFVPQESVDSIEQYLPDNPRKLKVLVRSLISLKPQLDRHRPDELDWSEIWLAEMVRQESYPLFIRLLESGALDNLAGIGYRLKNSDSGRRSNSQQSANNADIEAFINEAGSVSPKQMERLIELINATRAIAGMRLFYNWKFAWRPEALTWKEFSALLEKWRLDRLPQTISDWIADHSEAQSIERADIETELFETLLNAKDNELSAAASDNTIEGNARHGTEGGALLAMTMDFFQLQGTFTPERFKKFYDKSIYWMAFRFNESDSMLRVAERQAITSLLQNAPVQMAPGLLEALEPWDPWGYGPEDPKAAELKTAFRSDSVALILPKVEQAFVDSLALPDGIKRLANVQKLPAFFYILFRQERLPWQGIVRAGIMELISKASASAVEYGKVTDLLRILMDAAQDRSSSISRESALQIFADREFTIALWRGVVSRAIQFRMLNYFLHYRKLLIEMGTPEVDLPQTPEMEMVEQLKQASAVSAKTEDPELAETDGAEPDEIE